MVEITAVLDEAGLMRSCAALGHAGAGKSGQDIVCAAVSVLLRTAARVLEGRAGVTIQSGAPEAGVLRLETDYSAEGKDFLFAAGEFLLAGLRSVAEEFPNYCRLTVVTERRT